MGKVALFLVAVVVSSARGHVGLWNAQNQLQPVHSLYIKPSVDGTSGDLYVAATEDSGVKTQWLTDQPVNYLQYAQQAFPVTYSSSSSITTLPHDETVVTNQKRAVVASPPVKYAYSFPGASGDGKTYPYPYSMPSAPAPAATAEGSTPCSETAQPQPQMAASPYAAYAQYNPLSYYYAHLLSSFANALNSAKEVQSDGKDASNSTVTVSQATPYWPYSYPWHYPYMMVDPTAWAQSQTGATATSSPAPPTTTDAPTTEKNETD